jgi:hypothetical protein
MPHLQTILGQLNIAFARENIGKLVPRSDAFAPGNNLGAGVVVSSEMALHEDWVQYLDRIPKSIQEAIRSIIFQALTTTPHPTQITFAWAPGYDYELTMWQAPDTHSPPNIHPSRGGITLLIKSRYPLDKHPLHAEPLHRT